MMTESDKAALTGRKRDAASLREMRVSIDFNRGNRPWYPYPCRYYKAAPFALSYHVAATQRLSERLVFSPGLR